MSLETVLVYKKRARSNGAQPVWREEHEGRALCMAATAAMSPSQHQPGLA